MAGIVSIGTESREWVGLGCLAGERVSIPTVDTTPFGKFLPCHATSAGARAFGYTHSIYMGSDLSDLMEEDVWGDEASIYADDEVAASSFDDPKYLATYAKRDVDRNTMRTSRSLSPSQKSSVSMYSMRGMPSDYSSGIMEKSFVSSVHAPRSAPIEVPLCIYGRFEPVDRYADVEDDEERLPPHELLARQNARSQLSVFSVVEGVGRTLKGRDASKVRDAVWKQTGFLG